MKTKGAQMLGVSAFIAGSTILFCPWGCSSEPTPAAESNEQAQATQPPAQPASTTREDQVSAPVQQAAPENPSVAQPKEGLETEAAPTIYVVCLGDTLNGISKKYYGTYANGKWKLIRDANRDVLKNPWDLKLGMKLVIPAAKADASAFSAGGTPSP